MSECVMMIRADEGGGKKEEEERERERKRGAECSLLSCSVMSNVA
jgi:hypothetical protein